MYSIEKDEVTFERPLNDMGLGPLMGSFILGAIFTAAGIWAITISFKEYDNIGALIYLTLFGLVFVAIGLSKIYSQIKKFRENNWFKLKITPSQIEVFYSKHSITKIIPTNEINTFKLRFTQIGEKHARTRRMHTGHNLMPHVIDFTINTATESIFLENAKRPKDMRKAIQLYDKILEVLHAGGNMIISSNIDEFKRIVEEKGVQEIENMSQAEQVQTFRHTSDRMEGMAQYLDKHPNYFRNVRIIQAVVVITIIAVIVYFNFFN